VSELHKKNLEAIKNDNLVLSQKIASDINTLPQEYELSIPASYNLTPEQKREADSIRWAKEQLVFSFRKLENQKFIDSLERNLLSYKKNIDSIDVKLNTPNLDSTQLSELNIYKAMKIMEFEKIKERIRLLKNQVTEY
jgi:hypothetical protein